MLTRKQKEAMVTDIKKKIEKANMIIVTEYQGMTVGEISELRKKLKLEANAEYKVYKNTLVKRALPDDNPLLEDENILTGPNGLVFAYDDPVAPAKVIVEIAKKNEKFKIKKGVLDNKVLTVEEIKTLSELPGREEMLAIVLATMQAPISGFVNVCAGVIRGFVNVLNEIKKQKENT